MLMKSTYFPFLSASQMLRYGFILCAVLQFGNAKADDWMTYQHDAAHTGRSTADFDPTTLTKIWGSNSGNTQPIVVGNSLYELTGNGFTRAPVTLTSYNLATAQKNWSTGFEAAGLSHLTFGDGMLVFAGRTLSDDRYKLYAWDAGTGMQKYALDPPNIGGFSLTPTVARNANNQLVAYVASGGFVSAVALGATSG